MPLLNDEERKSINERLAISKEIFDSFEDRKYVFIQCRFCGWASNGHTLNEAVQENLQHEATHPEARIIDATKISVDEIYKSLHDHECKMERCACKCNCQEGPFCTLFMGELCPTCSVREMRGDSEHGLKEGEL